MPFRLPPILFRPITWDYVPGVSSFKNLVDLFYKFHYRNAVPSQDLNAYHFSHVKDKSIARCLFLVIPGACILVALYDLCRVGPSYVSNYVKFVNETVKFKDLSDDFRNNPQIATEAVEQNARNIEFVGAKLRQNLAQIKPIALIALARAGYSDLLLQHCGVANDDAEVAIKALRNKKEAEYLGPKLMRFREGLIAAAEVESGHKHPADVADSIKNDKEQMYYVAVNALRKSPEYFQYLGASCNDPRIVRMVIEEYKKCYSHYGIESYSYKHDMARAMKQILEAIGGELKQDLEQMKPFAMEVVGYDGRLLQYVGAAAQNDPEVVLKAAQNFFNHEYNEFERVFLPYIGAELEKDVAKMHPIAMEIVQHYGLSLKVLQGSQNDFEVVQAAVAQNPWAIKFVGDDLKKDRTKMRELVLMAVRKYGRVLENCKEFQEDFEVVLEAVNQEPQAIEFAGAKLMQNKENGRKLALLAISSRGILGHNCWYLLKHCGIWCDDKEVAMTALNDCLYAIRYVGANLIANPEFIAKIKPRILQAVKDGNLSWESDSWNWNIYHDSVLPPALQNDPDVKAAYDEFYVKKAKPYALEQLKAHRENLRSLCLVFNHPGVVMLFEKLKADSEVQAAEKRYQEEETKRQAKHARTA